MLVPALFGGGDLPVHVAALLLNGPEIGVIDPQVVGGELGNLPVVQVAHLPGVLDEGGHVGGQIVGPLPIAQNERAVLPGGDEPVGAVGADNAQGVGPLDAVQCLHHRVQDIPVIVVFQQLGHHLGIRLALEDVPATDELLAQLGEVLDDAVVHHGDVAGARGVRVRVGLARLAVGGPTGVPDAAGARHFEVAEGVRKLGHLALAGDHLNAAVLLHGHTRRVVAAVFHAGEPLHQDGRGARLTGIADDSAHRCSFIESGRHEAALTHLPVRYCTEGAPSPAAFHEKPVSTAAGSSGNTGCSDRASSAANRTGLNVLSCRARTA